MVHIALFKVSIVKKGKLVTLGLLPLLTCTQIFSC